MGYVGQHVDPSIKLIKDALKQQFWNPKSYSQIVVDLKGFKQGPTELVWEADQWLKKVIKDGEFQYDDRKHKEWFITMLLPHLRGPMGQQEIETQEKALEIAIKLEAAPRDDA